MFWGRKNMPAKPHWTRSRLDDCNLVSDDVEESKVVKMSFGYHGEIFITFEDGRRTCVWPTGECIAPYQIEVKRTK